jgi:AbrB family looped-hinge helix DNA binding protein
MEAIQVSVTSKYQVTVPKRVRDILRLEKGNKIVYVILDDQKVMIQKSLPFDVEYLNGLNATLSEWELSDDDQAYGKL